MGPEASLEGVMLLRKRQDWRVSLSADLEEGHSGRGQSKCLGPEVEYGTLRSRKRREGHWVGSSAQHWAIESLPREPTPARIPRFPLSSCFGSVVHASVSSGACLCSPFAL